jgi:hypothetical protein
MWPGQRAGEWRELKSDAWNELWRAGLSNPLFSLDVGGPMFAPWWKLSADAMMLALEAQGSRPVQSYHREWNGKADF